MNIRYPVEINLHGELVDQNGTVLARDVEEGALREVLTYLVLMQGIENIRQAVNI